VGCAACWFGADCWEEVVGERCELVALGAAAGGELACVPESCCALAEEVECDGPLARAVCLA
jgi:hypothetical protein